MCIIFIVVVIRLHLCFVRFEESQRPAVVDFASEVQETIEASTEVAAEASVEDDNYSDVGQPHDYTDEHQLDTVSASYMSLSEGHVMTDRKPPLVKKGKAYHRNIKSTFEDIPGRSIGSFMSSDNIPEVPRSAEIVRRKLRLPWRKKKKKQYLPEEELSRWRWNFESWRCASQLSLDTCSVTESENVTHRGLRRTASHDELHDVDSMSVGCTDSDTDTISDDHMGGALPHDKGIFLFILLLQLVMKMCALSKWYVNVGVSYGCILMSCRCHQFGLLQVNFVYI